MTYLTDHRAEVRRDPRNLLPSARSILMCGVLYNTEAPLSTEFHDDTRGWISRYAWGRDYHDVLRERFEKLIPLLPPCQYRICIDTAPLLERAYARRAGLGWIGKNTCLINEPKGSWYFLGALLLSLELQPGEPPPDRCGSCTRCIDACPTAALVPTGHAVPAWELDSNLCISYHTIESRVEIPEALGAAHGNHVFGCDICQDVCPWNSRAPVTDDPAFQPRHFAPPLKEIASLSEDGFRREFRDTPVWRAKHRGLLRNAAMAIGNSETIK
jgi:epoxyqueuosine reductase